MLWTLLALLSGSYADMVKNPQDMRFCAAAAQVTYDETAAKRGKDSLEARLHARIAGMFMARLRDLGATDPAALAATRKSLGNSDADEEQYHRCGLLAMGAPDDGDLVKAAQKVDEAVAEAIATAPAIDEDAPSAAEAAAGADAAADAYDAAKMQAPAWLDALPATRRGEIRCAMLANLVMHEVGRGVRTENHGLTIETAETLAGRLAEAIMAENGYDAVGVRAIYNADFERFAAQTMDMDEAQSKRLFAEEIGMCGALYDSIDLSGGGDGIVRGLAPIETFGLTAE